MRNRSRRIALLPATVLAFAAALVVARSAPSKQQIYAAGDRAGKWGIETYFVAKAQAGQVHVTLTGAQGVELGFVELPARVSETGLEKTTISWKGDEVEIELDKSTRRVDLRKNGVPILAAQTGESDPAGARFAAQHAELIAVLTTVIDDLRALGAVEVRRHLPKQVCRDVSLGGLGPSDVDWDGAPNCTGDEHYSCGWPDWTRSGACESAIAENASDCGNGYCIGCCQSSDCDCLCFAEDFLCDCCRRGTACGPPLEEPAPSQEAGETR
jgi:hypothetical protein